MNEPLLEQTDKQFWHRYTSLYDQEMIKLSDVREVLEFGVFKGNSIRWLMKRFPYARIYGCDICACQPEWPIAEEVQYFKVDQGSPDQLRNMFEKIGAALDFVIEDGSHLPVHQKNCLVESLKHIRPGGIYILEDIHTSHPEHGLYQQDKSRTMPYVGPLHLLLALEHLKSISCGLDSNTLAQLSDNSIFTTDEIEFLFGKIKEIKIYKRATLPDKCYSCGASDYDYTRLKCHCGVDIYEVADSMTTVLRIGR